MNLMKKNNILTLVMLTITFVAIFSIFLGWIYTLIIILTLVCSSLIFIWHVSNIVVLLSCLFTFIGFVWLSYKLMRKYLACCRKSLAINNKLSVDCKLIPTMLSFYGSLITGALLTIHHISFTLGDILINIFVVVLCLAITTYVYFFEDCYSLLKKYNH